jgi:hypothetical protein
MPDADRVGMVGEHNGDRFGRPDVHVHQFGRELRQLLDRFAHRNSMTITASGEACG